MGVPSLTAQWLVQLRSCEDYCNASEIAEEHRATLKRCVRAALLEATTELETQEITQNDGKPWKPDELKLLAATCKKLGHPTSWTVESHNLAVLGARLKRNIKAIRRKAIELGLSEYVDYWYAKSKGIVADEEDT